MPYDVSAEALYLEDMDELQASKETDAGYMATMMSFDQRARISDSLNSAFAAVEGNNDAIVGVMRVMAAFGVGGSVATLHGLESANDPNLSILTGLEAAKAEGEKASDGMFRTFTNWVKSKWNSMLKYFQRKYAEFQNWRARLKAGDIKKMEAATKYAQTKHTEETAKKALAEAKAANVELEKSGSWAAKTFNKMKSAVGADDVSKATRNLKKATTEFNKADTIYRKGWNMRRLQVALEDAIDAVKPANLKASWDKMASGIKDAFSGKGASGLASVMRRIRGLSNGWWAAIALASAAIIGVCVALWKAYKKEDPEGAAEAEKEGDSAESAAK